MMAGFDSLSVRDLVGLVVIAMATLRGGPNSIGAEQFVDDAFEIADQFVAKSEGKWSSGARANHQTHTEAKRSKGDPGR